MSRLLAIAGICAALGVAACGDDDDDSAAQTTTETPSAQTTTAEQGGSDGSGAGSESKAKAGTAITTADSQFGEAIFDSDKRAIYYFDKEKSSTSECYGDCAAAWPPVLTEGEPQASGGAEAKLLGTTDRDDGTTQVTYDGRPLYYYVDDPPGQILCHNVVEFGGLWLAIQPDGAPFA